MRIKELFKQRRAVDEKAVQSQEAEQIAEADKEAEAENAIQQEEIFGADRAKAIIAELIRLDEAGKLLRPIEKYIQDPDFLELVTEYDVKAAVRIYDAESDKKSASESARQSAIDDLTRRKSMPRPIRASSPAKPETDFSRLSKDEFERLRKKLKTGHRA